jgi:hypothetical protein
VIDEFGRADLAATQLVHLLERGQVMQFWHEPSLGVPVP